MLILLLLLKDHTPVMLWGGCGGWAGKGGRRGEEFQAILTLLHKWTLSALLLLILVSFFQILFILCQMIKKNDQITGNNHPVPELRNQCISNSIISSYRIQTLSCFVILLWIQHYRVEILWNYQIRFVYKFFKMQNSCCLWKLQNYWETQEHELIILPYFFTYTFSYSSILMLYMCLISISLWNVYKVYCKFSFI